MPDYDNIPRVLPKGWRGCSRAAAQGTRFLAEKIHHLTAKEINHNPHVREAVGLLEELLPQLQQIAAAPIEERFTATLKLPSGAESTRLKAALIQSAERLVVEMAWREQGSSFLDTLRDRLYHDFCLAIPQINVFGPLLTMGVPYPYEDVDRAHNALMECEANLRERMEATAKELAANPQACKVKPVKSPTLPKLSQEELIETEIVLDLSELRVGE